MSAYSEVQTQFTDAELLVDALKEMGYEPRVCIGKPQPLRGVSGDYRTADGQGHTNNPEKAMRAEVIIPREQVGGCSNELGFIRGADGRFTAIVSEYDSYRNWTAQHSQKLAGVYAEKKIVRDAKRAGLRMTGRKVENGKVQYLFVRG